MRRLLLVAALLGIAAVVLPPLYYKLVPPLVPDMPPPGRRIQVAEGVAVNAIERGSGPAVVLVHGLPGSGYDWAPLIVALENRGVHVIAYDRVGYGRSDARRNGEYTVSGNGRDLAELLRSEDLHDATLVGWSYGGPTVIAAAKLVPERVGGLVLVGSGGPSELRARPPAIFRLIFSAPMMAWYGSIPPLSRRLQRMISQQAYSEQPQPPWWLPQLAANFAMPHTRETYRKEIEHADSEDPDPTGVTAPILLIHGDDDRLAPIANAHWLKERAANAKLHVVPGGSHMLPITHTETLADRIAGLARGRLAGS